MERSIKAILHPIKHVGHMEFANIQFSALNNKHKPNSIGKTKSYLASRSRMWN